MTFLILFMSGWIVVYVYTGFRLIGPSGLHQPYRALAWMALAVTVFIGPLTLFAGRITPKPSWYPDVAMAAFWAMGIMLLILPLLLTRDLGMLLGGITMKVRSLLGAGSGPAFDPARRQFFMNVVNLILLGSTGVLSGVGYAVARKQPPKVVRLDIPIGDLPAAFDGLKISQITDLHIGASLIRRNQVQAIVEAVNAEKPDIIVLTGDLADGYVQELREDTAPLAGLRAPDGKYFITGNHDYYWDPAGWLSEVRNLGFTILTNEHRVLRRGESCLVIAGVPDFTAAYTMPKVISDPEAAARGGPSNTRKILLAHRPGSCYAAERAGFDLQISGHTHGGQFWPWTWLIHIVQPFSAGLYRFRKTRLYVSRGTGTWGPPTRLGNPSEIPLLTLRCG